MFGFSLKFVRDRTDWLYRVLIGFLDGKSPFLTKTDKKKKKERKKKRDGYNSKCENTKNYYGYPSFS